MKTNLLSLIVVFSVFITAHAQTFSLNVINGYSSGNYQAGDTVHIWSKEYDTTQTFTEWTGDVQYLESTKEWHTTLIMPSQNLSVTAVIDNMPAYTIHYEQIMGKNNLKNVYSCFPTNLKGVIFLFHGTGGIASNWIDVTEYRSFVDAAIANNFGVIVTEAEEITLNTDLNGDGKLRWHTFPIDTINGIDYLNIKIITDTFINRGNITSLTPIYSVGMSNGGSYSAAISYIYNYQAGVSYCASSAQAIFNLRNNPFAFRMAKYDNNPQVGPTGNHEAWQRDSILASRGICHDYKIHEKQPIYPERFARILGVSIANSQAIFNDLLNNGQLDANDYALPSDTIKSNILAQPILYPNIVSLSIYHQREVLNQIAASNAEHKFYSDYNYVTLNFFDNLCASTATIQENKLNSKINIFPNPTNGILHIKSNNPILKVEVYNIYGKCLKSVHSSNISIETLPKAVYWIKATLSNGCIVVRKVVKE